MRHFAVSFYLQEDSPYAAPVDTALSALWEAGVNNKVLNDALGAMDSKSAVVDAPRKLSLEGARPALVVLVAFIVISTLVFLAEFTTKYSAIAPLLLD